jgi:spermidine synthase
VGASLPALLLLFVGSGAAALIYETVWLQLLQLVIGSSAVSVGVLLGTFMGGMCIGSMWLPRTISARRHPLQVYACLELGIGAFGLLLLAAMPLVGRVYFAWSGTGLAGFLTRSIVAAVCLLPPTVLMGATLPAVSRWIETTPEGVSWLGWFYAGNLGGAVCGCLAAGFYLLRFYDMAAGVVSIHRDTAGSVAPIRTVGGSRHTAATMLRVRNPARPVPLQAKYTRPTSGIAASNSRPNAPIPSSRQA